MHISSRHIALKNSKNILEFNLMVHECKNTTKETWEHKKRRGNTNEHLILVLNDGGGGGNSSLKINKLKEDYQFRV